MTKRSLIRMSVIVLRTALFVTPTSVREARGALFNSLLLGQTVVPAVESVGMLAQRQPGLACCGDGTGIVGNGGGTVFALGQ